MPKSANSRRDRSDRDGHDEPYDEANRDGSKKEKKRSRHDDDDDEGGVPDEFGRRRRRRHSSRNDEDIANNGTAAAAVEDETAPCPTFASMNLKPDLLRGIYGHGFEKPSAIQQRAVRPIVRGRDVIAQSQSGTGKFIPSSSDIILSFRL